VIDGQDIAPLLRGETTRSRVMNSSSSERARSTPSAADAGSTIAGSTSTPGRIPGQGDQRDRTRRVRQSTDEDGRDARSFGARSAALRRRRRPGRVVRLDRAPPSRQPGCAPTPSAGSASSLPTARLEVTTALEVTTGMAQSRRNRSDDEQHASLGARDGRLRRHRLEFCRSWHRVGGTWSSWREQSCASWRRPPRGARAASEVIPCDLARRTQRKRYRKTRTSASRSSAREQPGSC
jgi:hypothetical protein